MIISHIKEIEPGKWKFQSNEEHSSGVAALAAKFAKEFGCEEWGRVLGLLHDKGKEQDSFQDYIRHASGYDIRSNAISVRHAYVGALIAKKLYERFFPALSMPIMGHHAGLGDWGDFIATMKKPIPKEVNEEGVGITLKMPAYTTGELKPSDCNHWIRMLFSCLVDADYLDTEYFMDKEQSRKRKKSFSMQSLKKSLYDYLEVLATKSVDTPVNRIRQQIQHQCIKMAEDKPGFFSLTVPTGGGKTISSVTWAVNHALKHGKKRIIIAIPYTSIIVQTVQVLQNIFGDENVLEHHSNVNFDKIKDYETLQSIKLATENWDYPIVVTTNVQLFESIFSNKPGKCRKLHNLCDCVLILDEVQTLPIEMLQPIVDSLKTYQRLFGMSVLFTTASMPVLNVDFETSTKEKLKGIEKIQEIIPDHFRLAEKLRRTELHFEEDRMSFDEIARRISEFNRVLCIVNTRNDAREIYSRLPKDDKTIHLSRMMCPAHIRKEINRIKDTLEDPCHKTIRVVSTQLIEAGVDIDFPTVFRQEAGLDSILQAAGRCNREGKLHHGNVFIFKLSESKVPIGSMRRNNQSREDLPKDSDWFSQATMHDYYINTYSRINTFDSLHMSELLYKAEIQFKTASERFRLIDDSGIRVVVCYGKSPELIRKLEKGETSYSLMKEIGQYSVTIRQDDFKRLNDMGLVEEIKEGIYFVPDAAQYKEDTGLAIESHWLEEPLMI